MNEGTRYRVRRALEFLPNTGARASVARLLASAVHNYAHIAAWAPRCIGYVPPVHVWLFLFILALIKHISSPFPAASRPTSLTRLGKRSLAPTRKASFP